MRCQKAPNFPSSRRTSPVSLSERGTYERLTLSTQHGRTQLCDQPQDFGKEVSWNRDLGHLEGNIAAVVDDLRRASLDLQPQRHTPTLPTPAMCASEHVTFAQQAVIQ
jgi:hypothetical protein